MTDAQILVTLKIDLQLSTPSLDTYLLDLIGASREYIKDEGIILTDSIGDGNLVEMYAAYLYRKRRGESDAYGKQVVAMPRPLRWALNNRLFSQKGKTDG